MAGTTQADRAGRDARGSAARSCDSLRGRTVRRHPIGGTPLGVELTPVNVRDAEEIERAVTTFARRSNGGLIVTASALAVVHRDLIITLAARHKLPAIFPFR